MEKLSEIKPEEMVTLQVITERLVEKIKKTTPEPVLYDLGSGFKKLDGFVGVDLHADGADIRHDLFHGDWSFTPDGSVDLFYSAHFLEHVPDWNLFFTNVHKKLKVGGYMINTTPFGNSVRAWQDPDHKRPIFFETYWYLNAEWRAKNNVSHYEIPVDFDIIEQFPAWNKDFKDLNPEAQKYHFFHTFNAVDDITVIIRKREEIH